MLQALLSVALIGVSTLLIGLVLLQKNRGSGLSGAFGGVGGHTAFGTRTGDVMTWITVSLTAMFLLLSIAAVYAFEPDKTADDAAVAPPSAVAPIETDAAGDGAAGDATPAGGSTLPPGAFETISIPAATGGTADAPADKTDVPVKSTDAPAESKTESTPPPSAGSE
jgi:preprotein translocase subunit SecG